MTKGEKVKTKGELHKGEIMNLDNKIIMKIKIEYFTLKNCVGPQWLGNSR